MARKKKSVATDEVLPSEAAESPSTPPEAPTTGLMIDELTDEMIELLRKTPPGVIESMLAGGFVGYVDSPDGFNLFYQLIHDNEPPEHVKKWVNGIYEAEAEGYEGVEAVGISR